MILFPDELHMRATQAQWRRAGSVVSGAPSFGGVPPPRSDWSGGGWWVCELPFKLTSDGLLLWEKLINQLGDGRDEFVIKRHVPGYTHLQGVTWACGGGAERATVMNIANTGGRVLKGGESFTVLHPNAGPRLYSLGDVAAPSGGQQLCKFLPPLREAVPANEIIDFASPRCTMRIITDPKTLWPTIMPPYKASPALTAVESTKWLEVVS